MKNRLREIKNLLKNILKIIIRSIQKVLITVLLALLYIFGLGVTRIYLSIFNRKFLKRKSAEQATWWEGAIGYDIETNTAVRQS